MERVRIDKWLWAARFFKTRSAATEAVLGRRVRVNGASVKPSKEIRAGDMVQLTIRSGRRTVEVVGLSEKRGPPTTAATLYSETPESTSARESAALERRLAGPPGADLGSRPTKLARRRLEEMRRAHRRGRSD